MNLDFNMRKQVIRLSIEIRVYRKYYFKNNILMELVLVYPVVFIVLMDGGINYS